MSNKLFDFSTRKVQTSEIYKDDKSIEEIVQKAAFDMLVVELAQGNTAYIDKFREIMQPALQFAQENWTDKPLRGKKVLMDAAEKIASVHKHLIILDEKVKERKILKATKRKRNSVSENDAEEPKKKQKDPKNCEIM